MQTTEVKILGTKYEVSLGTQEELGLSDTLAGECRIYGHSIKVEHSMKDVESEEAQLQRTHQILAHEVFHAFVNESGLTLDEDVEERLACWYEKMWRRMNNAIFEVLDNLDLPVDNVG